MPTVLAVPVVAMPFAMPLDGDEIKGKKAVGMKPADWESNVVVAVAVGIPMDQAGEDLILYVYI